MDDTGIIELYYARNERAITETDKKYGAYCRTIARNILSVREDVEECVNDTWFAVWNRLPPDLPKVLSAFLGRITRNLSISRFRAMRAEKRYNGMEVMLSELGDCVPDRGDVEQMADQRRLSWLIGHWLDSLDTEDRTLFVRRYWHGDEVRHLAARWSCTPNQMAQRMLRLRRDLKFFLEQEGVTL